MNSQVSANHSETGNNQVAGEFQFNKRFNDQGRNFTARMTFNMTKGTNDSYSHSSQIYYQMHTRDTVMNRYNVSPTDNSNISGRIMWSEPIDSGRGNIQLSYQIQVSRRNTNRETYVLPSQGDRYDDWEDDWYLPYELQQYRNSELSRTATNITRNHTLTLQFQILGNLGHRFVLTVDAKEAVDNLRLALVK